MADAVTMQQSGAREAGARAFMLCGHAMAEAALRAGCRFYSSYPISPSSDILEYMAPRMEEVGGVSVTSVGEVESMSMVWGAAATGVRSMFASTSTGFSLIQETLAEMANSEIPCVVVNLCRGAVQGDYHQSTKGGGHGDYRLPVLSPSTVQEAVDHVVEAFTLADAYRTPVLILSDIVLAMTYETVELPAFEEVDPAAKDWAARGAGDGARHYVSFLGPSGHSDDIEEGILRPVKKAELIAERETRLERYFADDAEVLLVAYGIAARLAKPAIRRLRAEGMSVGLLRPITLWPFPRAEIAEAAEEAEKIVVFELNFGQMVDDVRAVVFGRAPVEWFGGLGKADTGFGTFWSPSEVYEALGERCRERLPAPS